MAATTMHFGPEWMRKPRLQQPSPPPTSQSGLSTYSALVSGTLGVENDKQDDMHPFRYTKEELLKIYKENPKGGLGLEVERWEGVVRETAIDPVALREMSDSEKKLFAGPLNSELRRRQSTDYLSPLNTSLSTDRPRLNHSTSATGSPLRERYPGIKRRDSNADSPTIPMTRKQSLSSLNSPSVASRGATALPSPRKGPGFPSFDGVLSSGDTWTVRRRTSDASLKTPAIAREPGTEADDKPDPIPEDVTEQGDHSRSNSLGQGGQAGAEPINGGNNANNPAESAQQSATVAGGGTPVSSAQDFGAIEWSYKDPSGNIQGPFRADLMQKWYDDGYFAMDLPMKRTQLDTLWMTLANLIQRAATPAKPFLCAINSAPPPPGLAHRLDSPLQQTGFGQNNHQVFSNPYQPSPIRTLRSANLDSINGASTTDSPISATAQFHNNSPDSLAFANRLNATPGFVEPNHLAFSAGLDLGTPLRQRHVADLQDTPHRLHSPSYNTLLGQGMGYDHFGQGQYPGFNHVQSSPWGTPSQPYTNYGQSVGFGGYNPSSGYGMPQQQHLSGQLNAQLYNNNDTLGHQPHAQQVHHQGYFDPIPVVNGILNDHDTLPSPQTSSEQYHQEPFSEVKQDPAFAQLQETVAVASPQRVWDTATSSPTQRVPAAFESNTTTTTTTTLNTAIPAVSSQPSPWAQPIDPSSAISASVQEKAAWPTPSQVADDAAAAITTATSTLQVEQPSQQIAAPEMAVHLADAGKPVTELQAPISVPKGRKAKKAAAAAASVAVAAASTASVTPEPSVEGISRTETPSPTSQPAKTPWAQPDKKAKKASTTISLREIQENEAKLAEARKDKERARLSASATGISPEGKEDVQPFTASWGLPTSQTGSRGGGAPVRDTTPVTTATTSAAPAVWTSTTKPAAAKKTMKEIQEEEERRKKATVKEAVPTAPAKRGYADQATKVTAPATPASTSTGGGAWTTVGVKLAAPTPAARPASATVASIPATTMKTPTLTTARSAASVARPAAASSAKGEDFPVAPSHEFLKWLSESLKGLNSSVNVEEIIAMLLSFSLDPDPITVEIISDTIYASSTTLDGRRFAAEFVAKRKADSANRAKGTTSGKLPAKPVSIAEVVKATPKAQQQEWGFKVVNKKKKGGRA